MSILLFGLTGQLGQALLHHADSDVIALDRASVDLCDTIGLRSIIQAIRPSAIINAAAYTQVDQAETEPGICQAVNHHAVAVMAEEARKLDIRLISYSTDYVFDGTKTAPYTEDDPVNPLNVYGLSKYQGEQAIMASGCRHLILRASWLYSPGASNFMTKILDAAKTQPTLRVVSDQLGNPTQSGDLARATWHLIQKRPDLDGLYHCVTQGTASRYDWALKIIELAGLQNEVIAAKTSDFPAAAMRPLNSQLSCDKLFKDTGYRLPEWEASLRNLLQV